MSFGDDTLDPANNPPEACPNCTQETVHPLPDERASAPIPPDVNALAKRLLSDEELRLIVLNAIAGWMAAHGEQPTEDDLRRVIEWSATARFESLCLDGMLHSAIFVVGCDEISGPQFVDAGVLFPEKKIFTP